MNTGQGDDDVSPPHPSQTGGGGIPLATFTMARHSLNPSHKLLAVIRNSSTFIKSKNRYSCIHFTARCIVYHRLTRTFSFILRYLFLTLWQVYRFSVCELKYLSCHATAIGTHSFRDCRSVVQLSSDLTKFRSMGIRSSTFSIADPANVRLIPGSRVITDRFSPVCEESASDKPKKVLWPHTAFGLREIYDAWRLHRVHEPTAMESNFSGQ